MSIVNGGGKELEERLAQMGESRFHIHADLCELHDSLREQLVQNGFEDTSFSGFPEGHDPHIPSVMMSFWTNSSNEFNEKWNALVEKLKQHNARGYAEGESIVLAEQLPDKHYSGAPVPFNVYTRHIRGSPEERFRQTEFHLNFDYDRSDQQLVSRLLDAGLYGAYYRKPDGSRTLVLTMQGYIHNIRPLIRKLIDYVTQNGGLVNGKIKEEVAIRNELFNATHLDLPRIADRIVYS